MPKNYQAVVAQASELLPNWIYMGMEKAFEVVNLAANLIQDSGDKSCGLLYKPNPTNVRERKKDGLAFKTPDGCVLVDVLFSAGNSDCRIQWGVQEKLEPLENWREPYPKIIDPGNPVDPKPDVIRLVEQVVSDLKIDIARQEDLTNMILQHLMGERIIICNKIDDAVAKISRGAVMILNDPRVQKLLKLLEEME